MSLVGKYAVISGEDYYTTVDIIAEVHPGIYYVKDKHKDNPVSYFTMSILSTLSTNNSEENWIFFDTNEERETWLNWTNEKIETDSNIISLTKRKE